MDSIFKICVTFITLLGMVNCVSALTIRNGRKLDEFQTTVSVVYKREGTDKFHVGSRLEPLEKSYIEHHRIAKDNKKEKRVGTITHFIFFKGAVVEGDNKVPVSTFGKENLPEGGFEIALPDEDTDYIVIVKKDGEKTAFELYGAQKSKQRSRKSTRFYKVIEDKHGTAAFDKPLAFIIDKQEDEEDDDD